MIGDDGAKALAEMLKNNRCNLRALHVHSNKISAEGIKELMEGRH